MHNINTESEKRFKFPHENGIIEAVRSIIIEKNKIDLLFNPHRHLHGVENY